MCVDLWHNREGYYDPTAGEALSRIYAREKREESRRRSKNVDRYIKECEKAEKAGKKAKDELHG